MDDNKSYIINWDEFGSSHEVIDPSEESQLSEWKTFGQSTLSEFFDLTFNWLNPDGYYSSLDSQRAQNLKDDPSINIRRLDDGYQLEVERLNAIQQRSSRGFTIIDINPGLLTNDENPLTLPYEFLFDGTNFIPDQNQNFIKNFRSVNIAIAGTFVRVEYIYENNSLANMRSPFPSSVPNETYVPYATIKYGEAFPTNLESFNRVTGQTDYTLDNFARNKVYLDFGASSGKPHLIPTSGRTFKTYFDEFNIHLNIGSPKIRITVGFNSEIYDSSNVSAINSRLGLMGAGRLFADSDTTLVPFCVTDRQDDSSASVGGARGEFVVYPAAAAVGRETPIISNFGYLYNLSSPAVQEYGYSVLWITSVSVSINILSGTTVSIADYLRFTLKVQGRSLPISGGVYQEVNLFDKMLQINKEQTIAVNFAEPIRIIIPAGACLTRTTNALFLNGATTWISYSITGYSLGQILRPEIFGTRYSLTSKFITDSTFLGDMNILNSLKDNYP